MSYYSSPYLASPRDKYLDALAQAEAAKAEYEASLVQERRRPFYGHSDYYGYPAYNQPPPFAVDPYEQFLQVEADRRRQSLIAAEEQARARREAEAAVKARLYREAEAAAKARFFQEAQFRRQEAARRQAIQEAQAKKQEEVTFEDFVKAIVGRQVEEPRRRHPGCARRSAEPKQVEVPVEHVIARLLGQQPPQAEQRESCARRCRKVAPTPAPVPAPAPEPSKKAEQPSAPEQGIEQFLSHIFGQPVQLQKREAPKPQPTAGPSSPSTSLKEKLSARLGSEAEPEIRDAIHHIFSNIFGPTPAPESKSLKEQLEARLYDGHDAEARDTERAIAESLKTGSPASASGKGKAVAAPSTPTTPAEALATIEDIASQFKTLFAAFEFPAKLDISPPGSPGGHSTTSTLSRLTFTANNAPVRYYEQALSELLVRLDAIESSGDETVRHRRKEVVNLVETALEEVDKEVETRAAMLNARNSVGSVPIISEPVPKYVEEPAAKETEVEPSVVVDQVSGTEPTVDATEDESTTVAPDSVTEVESTAEEPTDSITVDTFLLPDTELPEKQKAPAHTDVDEEPVVVDEAKGGDTSDWSEVDA